MNYILIAIAMFSCVAVILWIFGSFLSAWFDGDIDAERSRFTNTRTGDTHTGIWRAIYEIAYKRAIDKYELNQQRNEERKP